MDLKRFGKTCCWKRRVSVSAMSYDNWLSNTEAVCIADDELVVSADSEVVLRLVEMKYADLLKACTKKVAPKNKKYKICAAFGKKQIRRRKVYFAGGIERGQHCCGGILHHFVPKYHLRQLYRGKSNGICGGSKQGGGRKSGRKIQSAVFVRRSGTGKNSPYARNRKFFSKSDPTIRVVCNVEREVYKRFDRGAARV